MVDASTDRLELLAEGITRRSGLAVSVNGLRLPLVHAARGTAIAAIRYRLFDNAWGLHPQIKAHSPLRLRIIDLKSGRILDGMDYLNWKRHGAGYQAPPQTEETARRRVAERVVLRSSARGRRARMREVATAPQAPYTLDLRRH
jgi:uncharacterized protein (DUF2126 family)